MLSSRGQACPPARCRAEIRLFPRGGRQLGRRRGRRGLGRQRRRGRVGHFDGDGHAQGGIGGGAVGEQHLPAVHTEHSGDLIEIPGNGLLARPGRERDNVGPGEEQHAVGGHHLLVETEGGAVDAGIVHNAAIELKGLPELDVRFGGKAHQQRLVEVDGGDPNYSDISNYSGMCENEER